jgi:hypothetical protein
MPVPQLERIAFLAKASFRTAAAVTARRLVRQRVNRAVRSTRYL